MKTKKLKNEVVDARPSPTRLTAAIICCVSVLACLSYAFLRDGLSFWWRGYGGGIPYVVFWISFWFTVFPKRRYIFRICVFAVSFTCLLEVLQLWKPQSLMRFRSTRFGAALLGSGFDWNDFLPYFIGGLVGYLVLHSVCRHGKPDA